MFVTKQEMIDRINECLLYTGRVFIIIDLETEELIGWGEFTSLISHIKNHNLDRNLIRFIELPTNKTQEIYQIVCNGDYKQFLI